MAPALDLHTADLFVIAGLPVPDDLTPLDAEARSGVVSLVSAAVRLPAQQRTGLRESLRSLPQMDRLQPSPPPPPYERYPPGPGAMILRMLHNRNLGWMGAAKCLAQVTPHYFAASTIGRIGRGEKELTADLVAAFAALLAVPADDLAALTGLEAGGTTMVNPAVEDVASLIWDARRLTAGQLAQVTNEARSMLYEQRPSQDTA
ncbi:XRE family transcriptional regulator [Verrucosispora sp. SN26_14.1]|nr:XRE family transcriptional regulator [Verrucosispora sp. NA02020]TBL39194.1 XRE family transcriptional regulator [Verrucosispora sp. SN26_14.1]